MRIILILIVAFLYSCQNNSKTEENNSVNLKNTKHRSDSIIQPKKKIFTKGHLIDLGFPEIRNLNLTELDSTYFNGELSKMNEFDIYAYSDQKDIYDLNIFTVYNHFEVCWQNLTLVILDKDDNLISHEKLAEGGGCDLPSLSYSEFINDSIFLRTEFPDQSYLIPDTIPEKEMQERIISTFLIQRTGEIKLIEVLKDSVKAD